MLRQFFRIFETCGAQQTEVARWKRVRLVQRAHCNVLNGPIADTRNTTQLLENDSGVGDTTEVDVAGRNQPRNRANGLRPCAGKADASQIGCGDYAGPWENVRESTAPSERSPVLGNKPAGEGRRPFDRHLLSENRANGQLKSIPGAGHPQSRTLLDKRGEHAASAEMARNLVWVSREVE